MRHTEQPPTGARPHHTHIWGALEGIHPRHARTHTHTTNNNNNNNNTASPQGASRSSGSQSHTRRGTNNPPAVVAQQAGCGHSDTESLRLVKDTLKDSSRDEEMTPGACTLERQSRKRKRTFKKKKKKKKLIEGFLVLWHRTKDCKISGEPVKRFHFK